MVRLEDRSVLESRGETKITIIGYTLHLFYKCSPSLLSSQAHYNMCLPQRPNDQIWNAYSARIAVHCCPSIVFIGYGCVPIPFLQLESNIDMTVGTLVVRMLQWIADCLCSTVDLKCLFVCAWSTRSSVSLYLCKLSSYCWWCVTGRLCGDAVGCSAGSLGRGGGCTRELQSDMWRQLSRSGRDQRVCPAPQDSAEHCIPQVSALCAIKLQNII